MYFSWFNLARFLLVLITITQSTLARILAESNPSHVAHRPITFYIQDVLENGLTPPSSRSTQTQTKGHFPFSKPIVGFLPNRGIQLPEPNPVQTDFSGKHNTLPDVLGLSFLAIATIEGLSLGIVTLINELLLGTPLSGSPLVGKAQGVYVATLEDRRSHMIAMTVMFADWDFKDSLRFFGVYQSGVSEFQCASANCSQIYKFLLTHLF
ncbi:hypothetical protein GIB67_014267 [Kingdonia uniflora]|uniref:Dirigent protein n=1 Tax=Kingdonia uniflora TaxID=39325 RepID=A0A7J7M1Z8_9MAGN|nr:hypothetical protein GIB67_014267 [Kingdonia uniflora]